MQPKRPVQNSITTKRPMTPMVKKASTKPSDRPSQVASMNRRMTLRVPSIPSMPPLVPKKVQAVGKIAKTKPKVGFK